MSHGCRLCLLCLQQLHWLLLGPPIANRSASCAHELLNGPVHREWGPTAVMSDQILQVSLNLHTCDVVQSQHKPFDSPFAWSFWP